MIRNRMTKPQDKAGNLLKPKNSRESRLFFLIFSKEGAVFRASFCRALFFAGVKIAMPTHQKFASAIFLFSAKSKGSTAPFAAHALLAFLGVISLEITLRSAGISAEIFLIRQKKLSARSAQSNGEVLFWKSRKKKRRIGFGKLSRKG